MTDETLRKFWLSERDEMPLWFSDGANSKHVTWEEFKAFCDGMWKIYEIDDALVYVENIEGNANVHFSLLRGGKVGDLSGIRDEIHKDFPLIFAWVGKHNRGLRKLMEGLGFKWDGLKMYWGKSHGRMLEWRCYIKRLEIQPDIC